MDSVSLEISKINFLLENLYAITFRDHGADADDVHRIADEMRRQFTELPASAYGWSPTPEELRQYAEAAAQRMDLFFAAVRDRLRSAQEPDD